MCFSLEASVISGSTLIPAGVYCVWSSWRIKPRLLPLAMVPLFFGIQQLGEGFVWYTLQNDRAELLRSASLFYLFFALSFWPFWFPFLTFVSETHQIKRIIFGLLCLICLSWFFILYYPLWVDPSRLTIEVTYGSIQYQYPSLEIYQVIPKPILRILYVLCIALPMAFGTENLGRVPGICLAGSAVFTVMIYDYAFVSVWCFFAAILSFYLCWLFSRLKPRNAAIFTTSIIS